MKNTVLVNTTMGVGLSKGIYGNGTCLCLTSARALRMNALHIRTMIAAPQQHKPPKGQPVADQSTQRRPIKRSTVLAPIATTIMFYGKHCDHTS